MATTTARASVPSRPPRMSGSPCAAASGCAATDRPPHAHAQCTLPLTAPHPSPVCPATRLPRDP
eukprot:36835-Prymnesium_polylepis.1